MKLSISRAVVLACIKPTRASTIALMLTLLCSHVAAAQSEPTPDYWVVSVTNEAGPGSRVTTMSVIDVARIVISPGNIRRAWVWLFLSPHNVDPTAGHRGLSLAEFDCSTRRARFLAINMYRADGSVIPPPQQFNNQWTYVAPQTVAEAELDFVCGTETTRQNSTAAHSGAALTPQELANLVFSNGAPPSQ